MSDLYYVLEVCDEEALQQPDEFFCKTLKLKSKHAFPSPIGTEIFLGFEDVPDGNPLGSSDNLFLQVIKHIDPIHGGYSIDEFHMLLAEECYKKTGEVLMHRHVKLIVEYLKSIGWEEI